ncbi:terpene synthase family protein [Streptomyces sp. NPDC059076]|uniref:terpene synthase family protein n=1 Tax=unclassified Streptomyces TaxID=2593676 RepID=UPI0036B4E255
MAAIDQPLLGTFTLGPFFRYLKPRCSPHLHWLEGRTSEFYEKVRHLFPTESSFRNFTREEHGQYLAFHYPDGIPDRLADIGDWIITWFALDDLCTNGFAVGDESIYPAMRQAVMGRTTDTPFDIITPIANTIKSKMPPAQWDRFVNVMNYMISGFAAEDEMRTGRAPQDIPTYVKARSGSSGMHWSYLLCEYALAIDASPYATLELEEAVDTAVWNSIYLNDIISYRKEVLLGRDPCNYVSLYMQETGADLQEAVTHVHGLALQTERRILELQTAADPAARVAIAAVVDQMVGTVAWQFLSPRYIGEGRWSGMAEGTWRLYTDRTIVTS